MAAPHPSATPPHDVVISGSLPKPAISREPSGSGTYAPASHTRTQSNDSVPHATKKTMVDHLRKYESLFTLTPQRMRIIVDSFVEVLETGLKEFGQTVVCLFAALRVHALKSIDNIDLYKSR